MHLDQGDLVLVAESNDQLLVGLLLAVLVQDAHVRLAAVQGLGGFAQTTGKTIVHESQLQHTLQGVRDGHLTLGGITADLDLVGDFGSRPDDVVCLGKCDDIVRDLCGELGWADELEAAWQETEHSLVDFGEGAETPERGPQLTEEAEERQLEEDVEEITEKLREVLGSAPDPDAAASDKRDDIQSPEESGKAVLPIEPDEPQDVRDARAVEQDEEKAKEKWGKK